ncbi:MAG TPA: CoA transferase [Alphaproteobacteria bacterium]|nr:CoA transferase [Alphaproteobacteria bacterium]
MTLMGPLDGVVVIELCHVMAGPTCGLMLADMGADVIKVEKLDGDDTRHTLPPDINGESAAFLMMNRNKRGIVVDLKTEDGKRVLKKLLETADVVTENYRPDTMQKLGLDYEDLRKSNPGLIYGAISGFGRTGPYALRGGFDLVAQGYSGLMSITGEGPERPPVKVGAPVADITAGILLAMGILAAYVRRLKTGEGQMVDTSLLEAGIVHTYWQSAISFATGEPPRAMGSAHPLNAPYQAIRSQDGYFNLGAANPRTWKLMVEAIGRPELAEDPRFADNEGRMANRDELIAELESVFTTRTSAEWLEILEAARVPAGPILDVQEMHENEQVLARDMVQELDHPVAGRVQTLGPPVKFGTTPGGVHRPAPGFGQHTREVLLEYGFAAAEIEALAASGAIVLGDA